MYVYYCWDVKTGNEAPKYTEGCARGLAAERLAAEQGENDEESFAKETVAATCAARRKRRRQHARRGFFNRHSRRSRRSALLPLLLHPPLPRVRRSPAHHPRSLVPLHLV